MMYESDYFLLPGPTKVPPRILRAMSASMMNHRGSEFKEIMENMTQNIKKVFKTKNDVLTLTCSGTGGMEASVVNFINPGDKVIVASIGNFGERFKKIAEKYHAQVDFIDFGWGNAIDPEVIKEKLAADKNHEIKAILCQHNETSTAVYNPIQAISEARKDHPALLIVDSVSGLGAVDLRMDEWDLDVVIAGSQKAFMAPPGLAFVGVSPKAWEIAKKNKNTKIYFDLLEAKKFLDIGQTPYTPAISVVYAVNEALEMMMEMGVDSIIENHFYHRDIVRAAIKGIGLDLLAEDEIASPAVTAVCAPAGIEPGDIKEKLQDKFRVVIAGGQGKLAKQTFRIGHLGFLKPLDLVAMISALEMVLIDLGYKFEFGKGIEAAQKVIMEKEKEI